MISFQAIIIIWLLQRSIYLVFRTCLFFLNFIRIDPALLDRAKLKRKRRDAEIEKFIKAYPPPSESQKKSVVKYAQSLESFLAAIADGKITAEQAMLVWCHDAIRAHRLYNCLTEVRFIESMEEARRLDCIDIKSEKGPLHGLPVSIKDHINVEGLDTTVGTIKWAMQPVLADEAEIIKMLRKAGAIPFCKTNVPQTMMTWECGNPLWGRTINPATTNAGCWSPGGSSGGQAALLAATELPCSVGIGSDIAGSLRIPAHFCGISALKPSPGRISSKGCRSFRPSPLLLTATNGPMAKSATDLGHFSRVILASAKSDLPLRPLRVGLMLTDGFVTPTPACTRAAQEAANRLAAEGHTIVPFRQPWDPIELVSLFYEIVTADRGHFYLKALQGEPLDPSIRGFALDFQLPECINRIILTAANFFLSDQRLLGIVKGLLGHKSKVAVARLLEMQARRQFLYQKLIDYWKDELGLDVLLAPVNVLPATLYGAFNEVNFAASYTLTWNMFDLPAGVIPITKVDVKLDSTLVPRQDCNLIQILWQLDALDLLVAKHYDPKAMKGLPVGVQIVGLPDSDELILEVMKLLERFKDF